MSNRSKENQSRLLKLGSITSTNQLGLLARLPDLNCNRPMLFADLSDKMDQPSSLAETCVSAEVLDGSEQKFYSFRLQIGATLICWLADPYDPMILNLLQAWVSAGHMFFGLKVRQGIIIRTRPVTGKLPNDPQSNPAYAPDIERFMRTANDAVSSGRVKAMVKSEIDSVAKISKVRAFLI